MSNRKQGERNKTDRTFGQKLTVFSGCACFVAALGCALMVMQVLHYREAYVLSHAKLNDTKVKTTAEQLLAVIQAETEQGKTIERAQKEAVKEVLLPLASGNRQFYIFSSGEQLLFYQNEQLTANREGYSFDRLLEQFRINGGQDFEQLAVFLQTKGSGTARFSMDENGGYYIGLAKTFLAGETEYILIYCISENYLLTVAGADRQNLFVIVFSLIFCAAFIAAIAFSLQLYRKQQKLLQEQEEEIERKNHMIELFGSRLYQASEAQRMVTVKEEATGIYSEDFLYHMLTELQTKESVKMIVVLFGLTPKKLPDEIKKQMLTELSGALGSNQLLFCMRKEHYVLLTLQEEESIVTAKVQKLFLQIEERHKNQKAAFSAVYAVQKEEESLYAVLESAVGEYQKTFGSVS